MPLEAINSCSTPVNHKEGRCGADGAETRRDNFFGAERNGSIVGLIYERESYAHRGSQFYLGDLLHTHTRAPTNHGLVGDLDELSYSSNRVKEFLSLGQISPTNQLARRPRDVETAKVQSHGRRNFSSTFTLCWLKQWRDSRRRHLSFGIDSLTRRQKNNNLGLVPRVCFREPSLCSEASLQSGSLKSADRFQESSSLSLFTCHWRDMHFVLLRNLSKNCHNNGKQQEHR